jgi:uncharacterized protein (DUF2225 family)
VKKTEDKQVATGIPKTAYKTAYCSVCKAQYCSPKMQCPMCNTMVHAMAPTSGVGKNNVVGSSHTDTQHSGVEPKLLHQVVCRTTHGCGLQKGSNVSAFGTATSKPYSLSQAYQARTTETTVKDQEVKLRARLSTRSKELVQLAQSQMPCQSQTLALFGEARSQPAVYKHAKGDNDAAGFRSGYVVTKVPEVYGNF